MTERSFTLAEDFESFDEGTEFTVVCEYGDGYNIDYKLRTSEPQYGNRQSVEVTQEQVEESFEVEPPEVVDHLQA